MLTRFCSYVEFSVSGNGLHIYGKVDLSKLPIAPDKSGKNRLDKQFYMKNPNNGIELYIGGLTNRFAAFTGNAVTDLPLKNCTTVIRHIVVFNDGQLVFHFKTGHKISVKM